MSSVLVHPLHCVGSLISFFSTGLGSVAASAVMVSRRGQVSFPERDSDLCWFCTPRRGLFLVHVGSPRC